MTRSSNPAEFRSGNLLVLPELGQVKVGEEIIRLGPVNMQVLVAFLENPNQLISRSQFFDRIWKNQIVSDDVLTRCISDLRTQLEKASGTAKLIETVPKRGYRWLAPVTTGPLPERSRLDWRRLAVWLIAGVLSLLVLSTSLLWLIGSLQGSGQVRLAAFPIAAAGPSQKAMAIELDELLRIQLVKRRQLRYLSPSAFAGQADNPYPGLAREFGVQWIIEGKIREQGGQYRLSLSLVDAQTAMVSHTANYDIAHKSELLERICNSYIDEVVVWLQLDKD